MPLATAAAKDQGKVPSTSISRSGTPAAARIAGDRALLGPIGGGLAALGVERTVEHPPTIGAGRHEDRACPRVEDHVQRVSIGGDVPCEVSTEHGAQVSALVTEDLDVQPGETADRAVGAVGADDPTRLDGLVRAAVGGLHSDRDTVVVLDQVMGANAESDLPAELEQVREQHRLQVVLGSYGEGRGAHPGEHVGCGGCEGELLQHRSGQGGLDRARDLEVLGAGADLAPQAPRCASAPWCEGGGRWPSGRSWCRRARSTSRTRAPARVAAKSGGQARGAGADDEDVVTGVGAWCILVSCIQRSAGERVGRIREAYGVSRRSR